jgi:hypothetical protein
LLKNRVLFVATAAVAALAASAGVATAATPQHSPMSQRSATAKAPATTSSPHVLLGSYDGLYDNDLAANLTNQWLPETQALHAWTGKNEAVTNLYAGGITPATSTLLIPALTTVWNQAQTVPSVSWTVTGSNAGNQALANGLDDPQLNAFAATLKTWLAGPDGRFGTPDDRRLFLRPNWEANGDWYGYAPDYGDPSNATYLANVKSYVAMWQHLVTRLRGDGLDSNHVQFVWSVDATDSWRTAVSGSGGEQIANDLWPGAQYVNWIGVDGYNMGSTQNTGWQSPQQVLNNMVERVNALSPSTPIAISEVGTLGAGAPAGQSESTWISSYYSWLQLASQYWPVRMSVWFNSPGNGGNFRVFGPTEGDTPFSFNNQQWSGYATYRQGVQASYLVGSSTANPRLLTDSQFQGLGY